jgi:hypothetical protein
MRKLSRILLVATMGALSIPTTGQVASANNFITCPAGVDAPCFANNSTHTVTIDLGTSTLNTATRNTLTQSYDTTDLTVVIASSPSHDPAEDLYYGFATLATGILGRYACAERVPGDSTRCNHAHIAYSNDPNIFDGYGANDMQSLACHETGHSLALRHPADAGYTDDESVFHCMIQDWYPGISKLVGSHNVAHINGKY